MNKRIEEHVNTLFQNAPKGSYVLDIKEELLANLGDKYEDLLKAGKSEEEAFALVISGIGDIDNLIKDIAGSPEYKPLEMEKNQQKRGIFLSIGIALYVLSIVPFIMLEWISIYNNPYIGLTLMLTICAIATGFIVFGNSISKARYNKMDNSFVEEYKERITENNYNRRLRNALTSSLWPLLLVIYLAISFLTDWWHITWVIFIFGACIQQLIIYKFTASHRRKGLWHGILWTATSLLYFLVSFPFDAWGWSWMIFILAAAMEQIIRLLVIWKKESRMNYTGGDSI